jgi:hypothetical protein
MKSILVLSTLSALAAISGPTHFALSAAYEPPSGKSPGTIAVTFSPTDPDVKINEEPAPRLTLDPMQIVLDDKQPPPKAGAVADPENVKSLDLAIPVRFAVALRPTAPKGEQMVKGNVVYFYCSKREGWCKRGKTEVEFPVPVK